MKMVRTKIVRSANLQSLPAIAGMSRLAHPAVSYVMKKRENEQLVLIANDRPYK